jgi:hypothetical protein
MKGKLDLGLDILDHQLADADGRLCGKVDDLELDGAPGKPVTVAAILTGAGALANRLPRRLRPIGRKLLGKGMIKVPLSEVREMDVVIKLKQSADHYRVGRGDSLAARWLSRLPGS